MIDSRCGLHCTGCGYKDSHSCGGCIETNGRPFHGECPIATCCQNKGLTHCGECEIIPCEKLYAYSYLDPEHGDKPQGARVDVCRQWAAESGKHKWKNVLLTSGGFCDWSSPPNPRTSIVERFAAILGKPLNEAKVLFIPTAAYSPEKPEPPEYVEKCRKDLEIIGIVPNNITSHDIDGSMTIDEAMKYDCICVNGGDTQYLLRKIKETGFDSIIKKFVYADKVYVGISAGSKIATPNIGEPYDKDTAGLCLIHAYISFHCPEGTEVKSDLPLPHIALSGGQALAISWRGYEVIKG